MKSITSAAVLAAALLTIGTASATTIGLPGSSTVSTTWDVFSGTSFTSLAPGSSASNLNATLNFTAVSPNASLIPGANGDNRIYAGGDTTSFQINGVAGSSSVDTFSLVMKFSSPFFGPASTFYTMNFNGSAGTETFIGTSTEGSNTYQLYAWTWSGVNLTPGSTFQVSGAGAADHVSLDAVQLTTTAVPEASASVMGLLAMGGLLARRRRA